MPAREIIKGEKVFVAMKMIRCNKKPFTLSDASYRILNGKLEEVGDSGDASIDEAIVFALVDTLLKDDGDDIYEIKKSYFAEFSVSITGLPKLKIGRVPFRIIN
jgi:hypothetical protein